MSNTLTTQSDEITLLFTPMPFNEKHQAHEPHMYNGRRDKLLTLCASLATLRFNRNMFLKGGVEIMDKLPSNIVFDARLGVYKTLSDAFELILWRSYDCAVNAVSTTLHLDPSKSVSKKSVNAMNTLQKLNLLFNEGKNGCHVASSTLWNIVSP